MNSQRQGSCPFLTPCRQYLSEDWVRLRNTLIVCTELRWRLLYHTGLDRNRDKWKGCFISCGGRKQWSGGSEWWMGCTYLPRAGGASTASMACTAWITLGISATIRQYRNWLGVVLLLTDKHTNTSLQKKRDHPHL